MFDFKELLYIPVNVIKAKELDHIAHTIMCNQVKLKKTNNETEASSILVSIINDCDYLESRGAFFLEKGK